MPKTHSWTQKMPSTVLYNVFLYKAILSLKLASQFLPHLKIQPHHTRNKGMNQVSETQVPWQVEVLKHMTYFVRRKWQLYCFKTLTDKKEPIFLVILAVSLFLCVCVWGWLDMRWCASKEPILNKCRWQDSASKNTLAIFTSWSWLSWP